MRKTGKRPRLTKATRAPSGGPCQRLAIRDFDPDRFREMIRGGCFEHLLLEAGTLDADLERWEADGVVVDRGRYGFGSFVRGTFSPGHITICMARWPGGPAWSSGSPLGPDDIQIYPEGEDLEYRAPAGISWSAIQLDRCRLHDTAVGRHGRPIDVPARLMRNYRGRPATVRRLWSVLDSLTTTPPNAALPASNGDADRPVDVVIDAILEFLDQDPERVRTASLRRREFLHKAQSWMADNLETGYDSRAVCEAVGTTERTLQLAFREAVRMSPSRWFLCTRLNKARKLLLSRDRAHVTVTAAAVRSGFAHLGRFSAEYGALFGERPSETLVRRRGCGLAM
jgi:AraC family ethanolamine operon transcriptional activator